MDFSSLCDHCHKIENDIADLKENPEDSELKDKIKIGFAELQQMVKAYSDINKNVLGRENRKRSFIFDAETIDYFDYMFDFVSEGDSLDLMKDMLGEVRRHFNWATGRSVRAFIQDLSELVKVTAKQLDKPEPEFIIDADESVVLSESQMEALEHTLIHILKNSVGHGIEAPEEREKAKKNAAGSISISFERQGNEVVFVTQDDGQGLDLSRIVKKAIDSKIISSNHQLSRQSQAELIFSQGLSTSDNISEVSGRGVGMGACKQFIKDIGGSIEIELQEENSRGKTPFQFKISLPLAE